MVDLMSCADVRPMLFDFKEGGCELGERRRIHAHLAVCRECRDEERSEHELTSLLLLSSDPTPAPRARRLVPLLLATAAAVVAFILLPPLFDLGSAAGASVTRYEMLLDDDARADVRAIGGDELIEFAPGEYGAVDLEGAGSVGVSGPAVIAVRLAAERWTLDLFCGEILADVAPGAELTVRSRFGSRSLNTGRFAISAATARIQEEQDEDEEEDVDRRSPAELLQAGLAAFFQAEDMPAAETAFRKAVAAKSASAEQVSRARFYLGASLGRQEKWKDALELYDSYLEDYPEDDGRSLILYFQGTYARKLGQEERARGYWKKLVAEHPDSDHAKMARAELERAKVAPAKERPAAPAAPESGQERSPNMDGVLEAGPEKPGGYLVVRTALGQRPGFAKIAGAVASFHDGAVIDFDGRDFARLTRELKQRRPRYVLFVVPPDVLDVNLHRRILLASYDLDGDVFADFSWGYFTARDAKGLAALWKRTREAHRRRRRDADLNWIATAVASGIESTVYEGNIPAVARAAGYEGKRIYWATVESDPKVLDFVEKKLPQLEEADVIGFYGCGDPQGIWLFSDKRNLDRSKHWPYDPEKVGQDPEGVMPRLMASRLAKLKLSSPIVWSGTCHSAATGRVFVEGDIVSTFGRTEASTLHRLAPEESICLSLLDAGALAFLAPIAANHGMSGSMETDFAFAHGATLGETLKQTYDDVALAASGNLVLDIVEDGAHAPSREYVMQGGGSNRLLIGDPSLRPFPRTEHPGQTVEVKKSKKRGRFDVVVTWEDGFHPHAWDIFRKERGRDGRVLARVDLEDLVPRRKRLTFTATATAEDREGNALPFEFTHCVPEDHHGRRYLHLQVNAPRTDVTDRKFAKVIFSVSVR